MALDLSHPRTYLLSLTTKQRAMFQTTPRFVPNKRLCGSLLQSFISLSFSLCVSSFFRIQQFIDSLKGSNDSAQKASTEDSEKALGMDGEDEKLDRDLDTKEEVSYATLCLLLVFIRLLTALHRVTKACSPDT